MTKCNETTFTPCTGCSATTIAECDNNVGGPCDQVEAIKWECDDIEDECPHKKGTKCIELTIATCPMLCFVTA